MHDGLKCSGESIQLVVAEIIEYQAMHGVEMVGRRQHQVAAARFTEPEEDAAAILLAVLPFDEAALLQTSDDFRSAGERGIRRRGQIAETHRPASLQSAEHDELVVREPGVALQLRIECRR